MLSVKTTAAAHPAQSSCSAWRGVRAVATTQSDRTGEMAEHRETWMGTYEATCLGDPNCASAFGPPSTLQPIVLTIYPESIITLGPSAFGGRMVLLVAPSTRLRACVGPH